MNKIIQFIQKNNRFAITSHAHPDGDALGSSLALALALETLGKTAHIFHADPHPQSYTFLPKIETIQITDQIEDDYDGLFVLECNDLMRSGIANLDNFCVVNIDHHPNTNYFGHFNWVDPTAAAVGEMIYDLIKDLSVPLTPEIATNLYVAIMTDTGSFQFSNTHARTFQIAGKLASSGANPYTIAQSIYMNQPHSKIRLLGILLDTLKLHSQDKIATISLTQKMLNETGANANDLEGIANYALSVEGVLLAAFFREESSLRYRISLRSKDHYNIASVAQIFGGGGHPNAAGLTLEGNFEEISKKVIAELDKLLP